MRMLVAVALAAGCFSAADRQCAPGMQQACACPFGGTGVQTCTADGSGYGACAGCDHADRDLAATAPDLAMSVDDAAVGDAAMVVDLAVAGDAANPICQPVAFVQLERGSTFDLGFVAGSETLKIKVSNISNQALTVQKGSLSSMDNPSAFSQLELIDPNGNPAMLPLVLQQGTSMWVQFLIAPPAKNAVYHAVIVVNTDQGPVGMCASVSS